MEKDNFSFPIQCKHGTKRMLGCAVEKCTWIIDLYTSQKEIKWV